MGPTVLFTLLDPDAIYPLFTAFCDLLSIADIIALTRTCKTLAGLYRSLLPLKWNIDRMLLRFFSKPRDFRQQIGKTDALVSGSPVLQYFGRTSWSSSNLDVYVQTGEKADALTTYMTGNECYRLQEAESKLARPSSAVPYYEQEYQIYAREETDGTLTEIHVITTATAPILAFLRTVYSTILVNFFIYKKAFSIYPKQTFLRHCAYHLQRDGSSCASFVDRHQQRGWKFPFIKPSPLRDPRYPIQEVRRIGDIDRWSIPFEADDIPRSLPHYVLEYAQFSCRVTYTHPMASRLIDQQGFPRDIGSYCIDARSFTAGCLRYQYAVSPRCSWRDFLHEMEHRTEKETETAVPSNKSTSIGGSCPKETYFDDEILQIYSEWLQSDAAEYACHKHRLERLDWT